MLLYCFLFHTHIHILLCDQVVLEKYTCRVWSSMRVSKRSQTFHSGINYSFKTRNWKNSGVLRGAECSDCCIFNALLSVFGVSITHLPAQRESIHPFTDDMLVSDHPDLQFLSLVAESRPLVPHMLLIAGHGLSQGLPEVRGQKWS